MFVIQLVEPSDSFVTTDPRFDCLLFERDLTASMPRLEMRSLKPAGMELDSLIGPLSLDWTQQHTHSFDIAVDFIERPNRDLRQKQRM
jgi:hypothetical protein